MKKLVIFIFVCVLIGAGCSFIPTKPLDPYIKSIVDEPDDYDGELVFVRGVLNVRRSACTEMGCLFENDTCEAGERIPCNSCSGEVLLQEASGASILLDEISCSMREYIECNVGTVYEVEKCDLDLEVGETYEFTGTVKVNDDGSLVLLKPTK